METFKPELDSDMNKYLSKLTGNLFSDANGRRLWLGLGLLAVSFMGCTPARGVADGGYRNAKQLVMNLSCTPEETVGQLLEHKHRNLHTDQGWLVFAHEEGGFLVERIFMVSKFAKLSYRWRVRPDKTVEAASDRAQTLCNG